MEAAELDLSQAPAAPRGRLRVSLPLVSSLVLPVLGEFMRAYPEIELDLDFTDRMVDVVEEGFDAVVRTGEPADSRLSARRLGSFRLPPAGAAAHAGRVAAPCLPALPLSEQRQAGDLGAGGRARRRRGVRLDAAGRHGLQ